MTGGEKGLLEKNAGLYAIQHRGKIVIPHRLEGKSNRGRRAAFATYEEARAWGVWNYKGDPAWRVVRLPARR